MATKQGEFDVFGKYFGDIDVEVADRIGLKLFLLRLVAYHVRQAADAMPLKAPMQGQSC